MRTGRGPRSLAPGRTVSPVANVFRGGALDLDLSNGGTEVFVEVMMLALSALAGDEWDFRFAALIARQDQYVMGRGAAGFDLEDVDWGSTPTERARAREFVLRTIDLALARHRWEDLGYEAPFAAEHLWRFRRMVEAFDPVGVVPAPGAFPARDEVVVAFCLRHRVLAPLRWYSACVLCGSRAA